jgi:hypothetical protein
MRLPAKRAQVWQRTRQFTFSQEELNMGRPRLTEYLLKLATDAAELENYEYGPKSRRLELENMPKRKREAALKIERDARLKRAGVTLAQRRRVLTGNSRQITAAVIEELAKNSSTAEAFYGTGLAIVVPINGAHLTHARRHNKRKHPHLTHHVRGRLKRAKPNDSR